MFVMFIGYTYEKEVYGIDIGMRNNHLNTIKLL